MRKKITIIILSILYALFMVVGYSFKKIDSFTYIENNILLSLLLFIVLAILFYFALTKLFDFLDKYKNRKNKIIKLFSNHPFLISFIILIILWLPYIISYYPIILSPDPSFQIKQYFNIPNKYSTYVNLISEDMIITNHHPVIHTLLLGTSLRIGNLIGNDNLGLFIYSIIQIVILASALSYIIKFLKDKVSDKYLIACLLIFGLVPVFPFYAMSAVKDTIYTSLIIFYTIYLYKNMETQDIKNIIKLILLSIFVILFRNNGIYVVLASTIALLIYKKNKKTLLILLVVLVFNFSYNKIILPYFKVTPTSIREALSIPFQQTARYVKTYSNEVDKEEKKVIDKVLKYKTLSKRYNSELSDPVKNKFNKDSSKEELKAYFNVWLKEFKKHPKVYFEATLSNTYGYFYPFKNNWYFYHKYDTRIVKDGFKYHYNNMGRLRLLLELYGLVFQVIPVLRLLINIAFNNWMILFMFGYIIYKKKYKDIIYLVPSIISILVCFASPANTYFRYAMPYIFSMPLLIGLFFYNLKEVKK